MGQSLGVSPGPRRWIGWGLLVLTLLVVWVISLAHGVLLPFFLAFAIAYLLDPLVQVLSLFGRVHRAIAILLVYGLFGLMVAGVLVYLVPVLVQESVRLIKYVPDLSLGIQHTWDYWLTRFHQQPMPLAIRTTITATGVHLQTRLMHSLRGMVAKVFGLVPGVLSFLVAPILAFYVLKDLSRVRRRFWEFIPIKWRAELFKLGIDLDRALIGYIRGQIIVALLVGLLSAVWVSILGIPFAVLIGSVAAITDVIPYVGPIAGAIPAILLGLMRSPWVALYAAVGFIVIHQLEGMVISPKVIGDSVGLHPLVIIFAILAGGAIAGFTGLILAVPMCAALKVAFSHGYRWLAVSLDRHSTPSVQ